MRTNRRGGGLTRLVLIALVLFGVVAMHQLPVPHEAPPPTAVEHVHSAHDAQQQHHERSSSDCCDMRGSGHSSLHLCLAIIAAAALGLLALWWAGTARPFRRTLFHRLIDGRRRHLPPPCVVPDIYRLRVLRL
ncbi:hypothetical protein HUO13_35845 [Saccharopolyspora erythraea]|uniref:DUF6153 family protein n=1 Tax=Saccharopolyspora erythraea TaxID=1836 RepID=UPI001BA9884E|nr:DUF6153 family protein [Saccharopolyspora erythraea]QUH05443.1 hypothetical protein HUO13_35845 [Saccharopolyspora erythraea]